MTDLIQYEVDQLETSAFNQPRTSLYESDALKLKQTNNYYDLVSLISLLTSSNDIDYQLVGDFFLTFRSFICPQSLLKILLLRLKWCIEQASDLSHEKLQNIGKLTLVRTFVTIRHWLLNYFTEDFIASKELRIIFIDSINSLSHPDIFIQRIIANLKKAWTECCNKSWDEKASSNDYYSFTLRVGPQSNKNKRLSSFALSQQINPTVRNSNVLSTFDPNKIHMLPIPDTEKHSSKRAPKVLLNPMNSNLRLSRVFKSQFPVSDTPLYTSLTTQYDSSSRNIIRDSTEFPKSSTLSKVLPPTPVKKMEVVVSLPPVSKPQEQHQKGIRPLIESWLKTFHKHSETKQENDNRTEKFMKTVVSVPKVDSEKLNKLVMNKFDILSARTIDELEYLVRFHNEIISKHGMKFGLDNANESFSFIQNESPSRPTKASNIDNMNICETISNISKSVISFKQMAENDNRSYISYDSVKFQSPEKAIPEEEVLMKKKKGIQNLREFNFELDNDSDSKKDQSNEPNGEINSIEEPNDVSTLDRFSSSIISESTPNEIILSEDQKSVIAADDNVDRATVIVNAASTENNIIPPIDVNSQKTGVELKMVETSTQGNKKQRSVSVDQLTTRVRSIERPKPLSFQQPPVEEVIIPFVKEEVDDIPPRSPDRLIKNNINGSLNYSKESVNESKSEESDGVEQPPKVDLKKLPENDVQSFVSSYEDPQVEEMVQGSDTENNQSVISDSPSTPLITAENDGLISSTPNISPIKSLNELHLYNDKLESQTQSSQYVKGEIDLDRAPSFTRVSNISMMSRKSNYEEIRVENSRFSYLSKRSHKVTMSGGSANSIFSELSKNQRILNVSITQENETPETSPVHLRTKQDNVDQHEIETESKAISLIDSINSEHYMIPYPGVNSQVMAELACITDDSIQEDPIKAALLKLEGTYKKKTDANRSTDSIDSQELLKKVESLNIASTPSRRSSRFIDQRRKTKLFSLTPVKQKNVSQDLSSSRILMELLLSRKIENELLSVSNSEQHVSFILNFDSKSLAEQFTLIEKDCLLEIDWKELVDFKWDSNNLSPINSWLELLIQNNEIHGIDLCISRFNLTVNWIISEILLTKDITLRTLTIQRFIHIAQNCKSLQNYSTLMQILLALGSDKVMKLRDTWRGVEPGDILIYKNLESIASPLKNFLNLRTEINKLKPSLGCIPFLGLYLSDLIFNKEKKSTMDGKINFGKFMHDSKIVRSLIQCIQWSLLYHTEPNDEVLSKCLYIKSLAEEEMNVCLVSIS